MKAIYRRAGGEPREVTVEATGPSSARVVVGGLDAELSFVPLGPGRFRLFDGTRHRVVCVDRDGPYRHVTVEDCGEARFERDQPGRRRRGEAAAGTLSSPMPGTVVKVLVAPGDAVAAGQDLLVVEAMKMEIRISAPAAGVVRSLACAEGDPCDAGQPLVELADPAAPDASPDTAPEGPGA